MLDYILVSTLIILMIIEISMIWYLIKIGCTPWMTYKDVK